MGITGKNNTIYQRMQVFAVLFGYLGPPAASDLQSLTNIVETLPEKDLFR